jgi:hypothetical protein
MDDDDDYDKCGAVGGMGGRGNLSTRRKTAPVSLCPPQIPHNQRVSNSDRRGGKPATNHLSYGTAWMDLTLLKLRSFFIIIFALLIAMQPTRDPVAIERGKKHEKNVLISGSQACVRYFRFHMHNTLRLSIKTYDNACLLIMFPHCGLRILCKTLWMSLTPHSNKQGEQFKILPKLTLLKQ